jgi:hypothetical protein
VSKLTDAERTQVLNALKRNLNGREGWDQPNEWGAVYRAANGRMRCHQFPVPLSFWRAYGHPANLLEAFRSLLVSPGNAAEREAVAGVRANIPTSMAAMYLTTEGFSPPAHKLRAALEPSGGRRQRFEDMPDRVEMRQAVACDVDCSLYMVTQPRTTMVLDGVVDADTGRGVEVEGRLPEALFALLNLFLQENQR